MMLRYISLSAVPEIRVDPSPPDREVVEVEVFIPIEVFWELEAIIHEIRYCKSTGITSNKQRQKFNLIVKNYIIGEKERAAFLKSIA